MKRATARSAATGNAAILVGLGLVHGNGREALFGMATALLPSKVSVGAGGMMSIMLTGIPARRSK